MLSAEVRGLALTAFLRTVFFYLFLLAVLRIMGKRELGALGPLDLVVTFIMAEAAAIPIENPTRPLVLGVIPILTIMGLEMILSRLCLVSGRLRAIISGSPTIVIKNGKFVQKEMRKLRYSINDMMEQLREKGYDNLLDVETAILESDGELSVLPKPGSRPVQRADLNLPSEGSGKAHVLVIDGQVDQATLRAAGWNEQRLQKALAARGYDELRQVFLAVVDENDRLYVQQKN